MIHGWIEKAVLQGWQLRDVEGPLRLEPSLLTTFVDAPFDVQPDFHGPPGSRLRGGRGKDHPRYGRFVYAFAKSLRPTLIVEVGSYAGGTAVGWARALVENGVGNLVCIDNDTYTQTTYPVITRANLQRTGLNPDRYELQNGDSKALIPALVKHRPQQADIFLVDGDHTYTGALADITNGLPLMKRGGYILVHDVDRNRRMDERTPEHPHPVYEAFREVAEKKHLEWCILKFIRKHLGILRIL